MFNSDFDESSFQRDENFINTKKSLDKLAEKAVFENYQHIFKNFGFETFLIPPSSTNPREQLIVSIGEKRTNENSITNSEYLRHNTVIQITFNNKILDISKVRDISKPENELFILQFFSILPVRYKSGKFRELNNLLLNLNRILPFGALGLSDAKKIYFCYSLMTDTKNVKEQIVVEIVKLIDSFLKRFRRKIVSFVEDKESLDEIILQIKKGLITNW